MNLGNASGGTNWPGAGYDPETHIVYAQAQQSGCLPISLRTPPEGFSDIRYVMGGTTREFRVSEGTGLRQRGRCSATQASRAARQRLRPPQAPPPAA